MAVDWLLIRHDYINGLGTLEELAEKHNVSVSTIRKKSASGKWAASREEQRNRIGTLTEQKTQEKISDARSDKAATQARIAAKVTRMVEAWIDKHAEKADDTGDIRRIVQSCVDIGIFETNKNDSGEKKNNLLQAIQSTEEINVDDLPEVE